jgi:N-acetylmuramic acid 6-phosphate etherase
MVEDVLITEAGSDPHAGYEDKPTLELVQLMNAADATVAAAVAEAAPAIAATIDAVSTRLRDGGRLVYVGAGSSGLIAALDASECEATFSTEPGQVLALVAGGASARPIVQAAAEDDREAGVADGTAIGIGPSDAVVGVSASGSTPYVLGALDVAATAGALTACVVSTPESPLGSIVDHEIVVPVGPEFIAGSTRLKAGTAQKLVLNTVSTVSMIRLGKTYGNLMVDVIAANEKLVERVRRIVASATGASGTEIDSALAEADGDARVAIVAIVAGVDVQEARQRLEAASDRSIARALKEPS